MCVNVLLKSGMLSLACEAIDLFTLPICVPNKKSNTHSINEAHCCVYFALQIPPGPIHCSPPLMTRTRTHTHTRTHSHSIDEAHCRAYFALQIPPGPIHCSLEGQVPSLHHAFPAQASPSEYVDLVCVCVCMCVCESMYECGVYVVLILIYATSCIPCSSTSMWVC